MSPTSPTPRADHCLPTLPTVTELCEAGSVCASFKTSLKGLALTVQTLARRACGAAPCLVADHGWHCNLQGPMPGTALAAKHVVMSWKPLRIVGLILSLLWLLALVTQNLQGFFVPVIL